MHGRAGYGRRAQGDRPDRTGNGSPVPGWWRAGRPEAQARAQRQSQCWSRSRSLKLMRAVNILGGGGALRFQDGCRGVWGGAEECQGLQTAGESGLRPKWVGGWVRGRKTVCGPQFGLELRVPFGPFVFCPRKIFQMWVGGGVGRGWPQPQMTVRKQWHEPTASMEDCAGLRQGQVQRTIVIFVISVIIVIFP